MALDEELNLTRLSKIEIDADSVGRKVTKTLGLSSYELQTLYLLFKLFIYLFLF